MSKGINAHKIHYNTVNSYKMITLNKTLHGGFSCFFLFPEQKWRSQHGSFLCFSFFQNKKGDLSMVVSRVFSFFLNKNGDLSIVFFMFIVFLAIKRIKFMVLSIMHNVDKYNKYCDGRSCIHLRRPFWPTLRPMLYQVWVSISLLSLLDSMILRFMLEILLYLFFFLEIQTLHRKRDGIDD